MADKQLTVAELMARAQKENPDAQPRRRRRRSLEEGGISVAELTGSLQAVDARPAEPKHSNAPIDEENTERSEPQKPKAPAKPAETDRPAEAAKPQQKPNVKVVKVEPAEKKPATKTGSVPVRKVEVGDVDKQAAEDAEKTNVIPVVRETPAASALAAQPKTEPQEAVVVEDDQDYDELVEGEEEYEEYEEDTVVNPVMLVLLVFAGLIVGVLVFLGFQALWENLNSILVGVLAVAVTAGIVLAVRRMKTGRDGFTMALAAVAGLAMTFGPGLIVGF